MPPELVAAVDDYRFERRLLSRAAAIRALIQIGLRQARQPPRRATPKDDEG